MAPCIIVLMRQSYPEKSDALPLTALLSATLVALTIELDNEFEHRMPHRTATGRGRGKSGPWLGSVAMYLNCMQFVPNTGIGIAELVARARTRTNFHGMNRWGYITIDGDTVRPTDGGRCARDTWTLLLPELEERWRRRFGAALIDALRTHLASIVRAMATPLPDCLPILGHGLSSIERETARSPRQAASPEPNEERRLIPLLSKVLFALAVMFERESELSFALYANVIRVLNEPTRVPDLPMLSGVSKEAIAMALGFLEKRGHVKVASNERGAKTVTLTAHGSEAQRDAMKRTRDVEERFRRRFEADVDALRRALEPIVGTASRNGSPLFACLEPYPEGWRATVRAPEVLPYFPMVLHRGGYPDGS